MAIDGSGRVYVADQGNARGQLFASDGQFLAARDSVRAVGSPFQRLGDVAVDTLGTVGSLGTRPGQFDAPSYLTISADGMLFVADESNRRVQVFRLLPPLATGPGTAGSSLVPPGATPTASAPLVPYERC